MMVSDETDSITTIPAISSFLDKSRLCALDRIEAWMVVRALFIAEAFSELYNTT
jgi:hypothetical protein